MANTGKHKSENEMDLQENGRQIDILAENVCRVQAMTEDKEIEPTLHKLLEAAHAEMKDRFAHLLKAGGKKALRDDQLARSAKFNKALYVHVKSATNLKTGFVEKVFKLSVIDPYVVVDIDGGDYLPEDKKERRTLTIDNHENPEWGESFWLLVTDQAQAMKLTVHAEGIMKDSEYGSVRIPLEDAQVGKVDTAYKVSSMPFDGEERGTLQVRYAVFNLDEIDAETLNAAEEAQCPHLIAATEFEKAKVDKLVESILDLREKIQKTSEDEHKELVEKLDKLGADPSFHRLRELKRAQATSDWVARTNSPGKMKEHPDWDKTIGLAMSGGGYRATLMHVGVLIRMNELALLKRLKTVTSVSGGSITNAVLALAFCKNSSQGGLCFDKQGIATNFMEKVHDEVMRLTSQNIRTQSQRALYNPLDILTRTDATNKLEDAYNSKTFFNGATFKKNLEDPANDPEKHQKNIPDFVFLGTEMGNGVPFEFRKQRTGCDIIGWDSETDHKIATAVACSSAFPLLFPPKWLKYGPEDRAKYVGGSEEQPTEMTKLQITDGGVYDNSGVTPIFDISATKGEKYHDFVVVSNAGMPSLPWTSKGDHVVKRLVQVLNICNDIVTRDRVETMVKAFQIDTLPQHRGSYFALKFKMEIYEKHVKVECGYEGKVADRIGEIRTDMDPFSVAEKKILINHGYALAAASIKQWGLDCLLNDIWDELPSAAWPHPEKRYTNTEDVMEALKNSDKRKIGPITLPF